MIEGKSPSWISLNRLDRFYFVGSSGVGILTKTGDCCFVVWKRKPSHKKHKSEKKRDKSSRRDESDDEEENDSAGFAAEFSDDGDSVE